MMNSRQLKEWADAMADNVFAAWHETVECTCPQPWRYTLRDIAEGCAFLDAAQQGCLVLPAVPRDMARPLSNFAIRMAIWNDHVHAVFALLRVQKEVHVRGGFVAFPLNLAAWSGATATAAALIRSKAGLETVSAGVTPIVAASRYGHTGMVSLLLDAKANINIVTTGPSPIEEAAAIGDMAVMALLLAAKAHVDYSALQRAARARRPDVVALLVQEEQAAMGVVVGGEPRRSALTRAAAAGDTRFASILLHAKATVNSSDHCGLSPLYWAVKGGHVPMVAILLQAKASVRNEIAVSPIHQLHADIRALLLAATQADARPSIGARAGLPP